MESTPLQKYLQKKPLKCYNLDMEKIEVLGKKLSGEDRKGSKEYITSKHEEAVEIGDGESEKSEDDYRIISDLSDYLQEELKTLGLEGIGDIDPNQIHFYPTSAYKEKFPHAKNTYAFTKVFNNAINADIDAVEKIGRLQFFKGLFHEMVHTASKKKYYLRPDDSISVSRSGYRNENPIDDHEHLIGLNEAIVDKITIDIFNRHRLDMVRDFDISSEDYNKESKYFGDYDKYIEILKIIVKRIADTKGEGEDEVWKRFKRGIFTGEMMHLRDIEKIYGKGALRMLDTLDTDEMHSAPEETIERVKKYFSSH